MNRRQAANAIRALSMDAVQTANSGHPGAPMGMADMAEVLFTEYLNHNPNHPNWINRDRFVLSNGHGSMLMYALLHLTGYEVSIDDIKAFRQWGSNTPGHPEYGYTKGVETTTGPLGQGLANAVGMALAEQHLAKTFNTEIEIIDHFTYVFLGDGCLMEGISHEVCSLAGTLGLGKLIALYDDNQISIDGEVSPWFSDDTAMRFQAYGWQVISGVDGHDADAINEALSKARQNSQQPSLLMCRTTIGYGSPNKAGSASSHGAPLGADEVAATKRALGIDYGAFEIPESVYHYFDARKKGEEKEQAWKSLFATYQQHYPEKAADLLRRMAGELPADYAELTVGLIREFDQKQLSVASRKASLLCLEELFERVPELLGGSADLTGSNLTKTADAKALTRQHSEGRYIYYGVREFGMSAMMNGMVLHGGVRPFAGTFLVFMEYARNAVRMAALMKIPTIFVYTHDSIGLGEDGPTHQPIEQLANLRATPNLSVWRPADAVETMVAWQQAIGQKDRPSALVLSRQTLPHQARSESMLDQIARGGYILEDSEQGATLIVIATGSEVAIAREAVSTLNQAGHSIRLVSMPSVDAFLRQDAEYQQQVLPDQIRKRLVVEAACSDGWHRFTGLDGAVISIDRFGESAPGDVLMKAFGFTTDHVIERIKALLAS